MQITLRGPLRWSLIALAASLTACASAPDVRGAQRQPLELPEQFTESSTESTEVMSGWQSLGDPVLVALLRQGLQGNLALAQAYERVEQARAMVRGAAGQRWPALNGRLGASTQQLARADAPTFSDAERRVDRVSAQGQLAWEIDLSGRLKHRLQSQALRLDARHADADAVRLGVAAEIASAWYALQGIRARIEITTEVMRNRERAVGLVKSRLAAGAAAPIDEARAAAELAEVKAELPHWYAAQRVQTHRLAVLLGEVPSSYRPPLAQDLPIQVAQLRLPSVAQWVAQRPDLRTTRLELAAYARDIEAVEADLLPRVDISGAVGFVAGSLGALGSSGSFAWALAPSIELPLFNRERLLAQVDRARSQGREAALLYRERLLVGLSEVESAMASYRLGQESLVEQEQRLAHAQRAHRMAESRWRAGAAEMLEWLDAQRQAYRAAMAAADALTTQRLRSIELLKTLGQQPGA